MFNMRRMALILGSVVAGMALLGTIAMAADSTPKIGVVDLDKLYKDAPRVKQYTDQLNVFKDSLAAKLDIRGQNLMLDENEIKELIDLKAKQAPTEKDTARIKELTDAERARDDQFKLLSGKSPLDDTEKGKLKQFQDMQQKSKDTGTALAKDYDNQLSSKMQELNGQAEKDVQDAINKVAEAKGLTMVVAKAAVLLGGIDITDDVISKLDRKM